ncbi:MAG: hypothetical protein ACTSXZ_06180 [Alphaproteobacteria bacterium]
MSILDKETGAKGVVGAGWLNDDGSMSIRINPGVDLRYVDCVHCLLTLFPVEPNG